MLCLSALPCAAQPEPNSLLRQMADAERRNRKDSSYFVYREDIRGSIANADRLTRQTRWVTYEVTFLEGESYHRPIARNGEPLTPEEQDAEDRRFAQVSEYRRNTPIEERRRQHFAAEENRYRIDSDLVARHHSGVLLGADRLGNRDVWLVSAQPRRGAPKPKRRSEWSLSQKFKYWIDQQTCLPLKIEAEQLYDYDGTKKGTIVHVDNVEVEGIILPGRIVSTSNPNPGRRQTSVITDQSYSSYKRFRTETVLLFMDTPPAPPRH